MNQKPPAPVARLTMITLGVGDMRASIAFYEALGFPWHQLAQDVTLPEDPRPQAFRGVTLAWNCRSTEEVDAVLNFAISKGALLLKPAHKTDYGGYSGYFADLDGHPWEVVVAPNIEVGEDRRIRLPD